MSRVKFKRGGQIKFLNSVIEILKIERTKLAEVFGVNNRTLFDWKREKYTLPYSVFKKCLKLTKKNIKIPEYKILPEFWSIEKAARQGGLALSKKYGGPGTPEGRSKGGLNSQHLRKLYPGRYKHCNIRKHIIIPRKSCNLAEFIGIVLGDGGINNDHQIVITLHKKNDKDYVIFVCGLTKKLFGLTPKVYKYNSLRRRKVAGVAISSVALVEFLLANGFKKGSKVRHQIGVPKWIKENVNFSKSCLRGLMDTDGGIYYHRHKCCGNKQFNIGLVFSNRSLPLLDFAENTLSELNFHPKMDKRKNNVYLYRESEVIRYARKIRFSNSHHLDRIKAFLNKKLRKGAGAV